MFLLFTFALVKQKVLPSSFSKTHTVTLTDNGFVPVKLTIVKDDTVVFKTSGKEAFWPASDFHPSHGIYPEFDSKRPIDPDESWSFTFRKAGSWKYHDHLASYLRGIIVVKQKIRKSLSKTMCTYDKNRCRQTLVNQTLSSKGLAAGFALIDELSKSDPSFKCHDFTHLIGEQAYRLFEIDKSLDVQIQKLSYCGFGFYHGYLTTLYSKTKNLRLARNFCDHVKKSNPIKYSGIESACYHGLGHGLMEETPEKKVRGNPHEIIKPALSKCGEVTSDEEMQGYCASGVFNSLAVLMESSQFGLSFDKNKPYQICDDKRYTNFIKEGCYSQMNTLLYKASDGNLQTAIYYAQNIKDKRYVPTAIELFNAFYASLHQKETDQRNVIETCRTAEKTATQIACIVGYAHGLIEFGLPEKEWEKSLKFCSLDVLSQAEKEACFTKIGRFFKSIYPKPKVKKVCGLVEEPYKKLCLFR